MTFTTDDADQTVRVLTELLYGQGAHVSPVGCVEDLDANTAACTIPGHPHSIWQNLLHMNYWMEYELARIAGKRPAYPEHAAESWPANPAPEERQWEEDVSRF